MQDESIRVVIANPTRFLREAIYEAIEENPEFIVVGEVSDEGTIPLVADWLKPDCVIIPLERSENPSSVCLQVLDSNPCTIIVAIGQGPDPLAIYWKSDGGQIRRTYGPATRDGILEALHFSVS